MANGKTLVDVLFGGWKGDAAPQPGEIPNHVLKTGLQELLVLLASCAAAHVARSDFVPNGFTAKFCNSMTKPTPGKLLQFTTWAATAEGGIFPSDRLAAFLAEQRKNDGWLSRLSQLRNRWAHPKGETPAQILGEVARLLEEVPEYLQIHVLSFSGEGEAVFGESGSSLGLDPFIVVANHGFCPLAEIDPHQKPVHHCPNPEASGRFEKLWFEMRVRDGALESPTPAEVREKIWRLGPNHQNGRPWWVDHLAKTGAPFFLVESSLVGPSIAEFGADGSNGIGMMVDLSSGVPAGEAIADRLGLAVAPSSQEFGALADASHPLIIGATTEALTSRDFLQVLYWLADLAGVGGVDHLRIIVGRSYEQLHKDQEKLWDRLPENLEKLLRAPPKSRCTELRDYLWTGQKPKKFLGLF